jgi:hypothetical protein
VTDQTLSSGAVFFLGHIANAPLIPKFRILLFILIRPVNFDTKISPVFIPSAVMAPNHFSAASSEQYTFPSIARSSLPKIISYL